MAGENPMLPQMDLTFDPRERKGLTTDEVEILYNQWGYNELPVVGIPLWWVFLQQFTGTMQYMLELAIVIAAVVQAWGVFGISNSRHGLYSKYIYSPKYYLVVYFSLPHVFSSFAMVCWPLLKS